MTFTKEELKKFEDKLIEEKSRLEKDLAVIARPDGDSDNYTAIYEDMGSHKDENATEVEGYIGNVALENSLEDQLQAVNRSLEKIGEGIYGICEECGEKIAKERLEVNPSAEKCMKCAN